MASAAQKLNVPSGVRRLKGIGMVERAATEKEQQLQQILQSLNMNQAQTVG